MAHTTRGTAARSWVRPITIVAAALSAALLPAAAHAATYYLNPNGRDTNTGLTAAAAWQTLGKANSTLRGGDVVILAPGTYSGTIRPANSGSLNARITYVGSLANPSAASVGSIVINTNYVTVKGVRANGGGQLDYPARYDSIAHCVLGSMSLHAAKYSMIARNTINGGFSMSMDGGEVMNGIANCERDTIRGNTITMDPIPATHGFKVRGFTQYCLIDSNRVTGWFPSNEFSGAHGRQFFNSYFITLRDNFWQFDARVPFTTGPWHAFSARDSSHDLTFERDTMYAGLNSGSNQVAGRLSQSGAYGNIRNNVWKDCVYLTNAYFYNEESITGNTFRNSVFASRTDKAFWILETMRNTVIDHCTFYSGGNQAVRFETTLQNTSITSNIFYSRTASGPSLGGGVLLYMNTGGFTANNNVYFSSTYGSSPGDRSIAWCCYSASRPGSGSSWHSNTGQDANSVHASPMFADSAFASFDAHLRANSGAIGKGAGGTDAGAFPYVPAGPDVTPPATVSNLATTMVSDQVVALTWTAPGGNGMSGLATAYDLRWSLAPITDASFAAATPVTPQPVPLAAGQTQGYVMLALTPGTTYYVALKAVDQAGNWSAMSNVLTASTSATDQTPPGSINTLGTTP